MYIHPFLAGILVTVLTEIALIFVAGIIAAFRRTRR